MSGLTKNERNAEILKKAGKALSAREIAELTEVHYPDYFLEKSNSILRSGAKNHFEYWARQGVDLKTSKDALRSATLTQISAEVPSERALYQREKSLEKYGHTYWMYFLEAMPDIRTKIPKNSSLLEPKLINQDETSLYPLVVEYWKALEIKAYRIDEKRASNSYGREGNRWLFPDIVGFKRLKPRKGVDFHIGEIMMKAGLPRVEFYSIEVKKHITRSSVRADYFQAVSNSTWANKGYLVAPRIDDAALSELKMLNQMHGIGVLLLDRDNPEKSEEIIVPLKKEGVGAEMMGRLVEENADFKTFIEEVGKSFW